MSQTTGSSTESKTRVCPKCKRGVLTRVARRGFLEENMFSRFGFYPWECTGCRKRVLVKGRGDRLKKRRRSQDDHTPEFQPKESRAEASQVQEPQANA